MPVPGLPPIEIKPSRMVAFYLGMGVAIPVLIAVILPLAQGEDLDSGVIYETVGSWVVLLVVSGSVIGLMLRGQRRTRARLFAEAPADTILATLACPLEVEEVNATRRVRRFASWSNGVLLLSTSGITFRTKNSDPAMPAVRLLWADLEKIESERENPFRLYLRAYTRTGQIHAWQVPGASTVEAVLRRLRDLP